ncbi:hypothetical protein ACJ41O_005562 [Fusarium nematophilum]
MSAKKAISRLEARVLQLEDLLRQHDIEQPQTQDKSTSQNPIPSKKGEEVTETPCPSVAAPPSTTFSQPPSIPDTASPSVLTAPEAGPSAPIDASSRVEEAAFLGTDDFDFLSSAHEHEATKQDDQAFVFLQPPSPPSPQQERSTHGFQAQHQTSETGSDIEGILSARMGSLRIAEDGQLRYYGPTSNLNVQNNGVQSLSRSMIRDVASEGKGVLQKLGLDHPVSASLEMHLAKLYFAWEDPAIHVVDEESFFQEKGRCLEGTSSPYYSETLNNAICAIGACLAAGERLNVPEPAAEFFSLRAKALLDIEMDSPTVATVQALVVMSASEAAFTRDARGWLYSGMAVRLSADLGLHLDVTEHRHSGLLTQRDLEIRRTTFWGVFIHEHMWSLYVGRPYGMGTQNITVARPAESQLDRQRQRTWTPYPSAAGQSAIPEAGIPFQLEACTAANASLCELMKRINTTLYSGCMMGLDALVNFLIQTERDLMAWQKSLPPSLQIDPLDLERIYPPAVLQLRMQFNATLISLYRPYLSRQFTRSGRRLVSPENQAALDNALRSCVWTAHDIAETLRLHQRQHSLRRTNIQIVHIIFTACLIFIYDVCTRPYSESRLSLGDLQLSCRALGEIGQCYGNATRALEVVILVKSEWQKIAAARKSPSAGVKRPSASRQDISETEDDDGRPRRRSRPSVSTTDSIDPPMFFMPPSYNAYETLLQGQVVGAPSMEAMQDLWPLPHGGDFGLEDLARSMDWGDEKDAEEIQGLAGEGAGLTVSCEEGSLSGQSPSSIDAT